MHTVLEWCALPLVSPREHCTVRRALMGKREGGIEFSSNCPLCQYRHWLTTKIDCKWSRNVASSQHKARLSVGSGMQWKWAIFCVDDIVNTKEKACDGNKSYDFSTPTVLSSPLVGMWIYLFLCLNIYSIPPENENNNNNTKLIIFIIMVVISVFQCMPYATVFVRCVCVCVCLIYIVPNAHNVLWECLPCFTNEEAEAQGRYELV